MNRITFPSSCKMKQPEVVHLQEALAFLSFTIAESETSNQRYGASTRSAVMQFQTAQNLPPPASSTGHRQRHQRSAR